MDLTQLISTLFGIPNLDSSDQGVSAFAQNPLEGLFPGERTTYTDENGYIHEVDNSQHYVFTPDGELYEIYENEELVGFWQDDVFHHYDQLYILDNNGDLVLFDPNSQSQFVAESNEVLEITEPPTPSLENNPAVILAEPENASDITPRTRHDLSPIDETPLTQTPSFTQPESVISQIVSLQVFTLWVKESSNLTLGNSLVSGAIIVINPVTGHNQISTSNNDNNRINSEPNISDPVNREIATILFSDAEITRLLATEPLVMLGLKTLTETSNNPGIVFGIPLRNTNNTVLANNATNIPQEIVVISRDIPIRSVSQLQTSMPYFQLGSLPNSNAQVPRSASLFATPSAAFSLACFPTHNFVGAPVTLGTRNELGNTAIARFGTLLAENAKHALPVNSRDNSGRDNDSSKQGNDQNQDEQEQDLETED